MPLPRSVFLLSQAALCLTDQGYRVFLSPSDSFPTNRSLFAGRGCAETSKLVWSEVAHDPQFSGYSVGALSLHGSKILALGNMQGSMKLIKLDERGMVTAAMLS